MRTIEELLSEVPALQALAPDHRDTVAGCARNCIFQPGERIMREGEPPTRSTSSARARSRWRPRSRGAAR